MFVVKLAIFAGILVYGWGVWKFWTGFNRTHYSGGKLYLALFWPAFMIANKTYRQNFNRALKG